MTHNFLLKKMNSIITKTFIQSKWTTSRARRSQFKKKTVAINTHQAKYDFIPVTINKIKL